ncbi:hypothetical protein ACQ4PT_023789 [Festuca glaucescens]
MAPWTGLWGGRAGGDAYRGTPVVVKMENLNWCISEISPEDDDEDFLVGAGAATTGARRKGGRGKNAKQFTWVLLHKAHCAAGCLASLASTVGALGAAARRRVADGRTDADAGAAGAESPVLRSRFYAFIKAFLVLSMLLLAVELATHFNGWNLAASALALPIIGVESLYGSWLRLAPPTCNVLTDACVVLFLIQSADRLIQCLGCFYINLKRIKPKLKSAALPDAEDPDAGYYPMVLVQIPMCNEKEVYQQSIAAVCNLDWTRSNFLVQVLDDSDDPTTQSLIRDEDNDELGLVQARWSFVNKDENLLTRLQNINLCFHFEVEQQVNGMFLNFFGFNGTAGVWSIKALEDSGGWMERTTVEDMDIAVRAHLHGWKFIFLNDVECQCALPESYEAYRKQQHRWHSGPMQLFRLCLPDIIKSKISVWKKANLIFLFFLLRKLILPFYSFTYQQRRRRCRGGAQQCEDSSEATGDGGGVKGIKVAPPIPSRPSPLFAPRLHLLRFLWRHHGSCSRSSPSPAQSPLHAPSPTRRGTAIAILAPCRSLGGTAGTGNAARRRNRLSELQPAGSRAAHVGRHRKPR